MRDEMKKTAKFFKTLTRRRQKTDNNRYIQRVCLSCSRISIFYINDISKLERNRHNFFDNFNFEDDSV